MERPQGSLESKRKNELLLKAKKVGAIVLGTTVFVLPTGCASSSRAEAPASVVVTAGEHSVEGRGIKDLSEKEKIAYTEVHALFEELTADDILRCDNGVVNAQRGPMVERNGREDPSIEVTLRMSPGDKAELSPWFSDKGHQVDSYHAEISWSPPGFTAVKKIGGKEVSDMTTVSLAGKEKDMVNVVIPFNGQIVGESHVDLLPFIQKAALTERVESGQSTLSRKRDLLGEKCFGFTAVVTKSSQTGKSEVSINSYD